MSVSVCIDKEREREGETVTLRPVWLQYPEERKRRMKIGEKKGKTESALIFQSPFAEKAREREREREIRFK
jgi:hypothetical protein